MYVVILIKGKQFELKEGIVLNIPRFFKNIGESIILDNILFSVKNNKLEFGFPFLKNIKVHAKILEHIKSDKVVIFKKKRRKGYKKKQGHRQVYTKILIENIKKYGS